MKTFAIAAYLAVMSLAAVARAQAYLVAVSNERSGDVSLIDGATRKVVDTIRVGKRPRGIAASRDGKLLYVALSGSPIAGPPGKDGKERTDLPPPDRKADGIGVIDLATRKLIKAMPSGDDPEQFVLSRDEETMYIANEDAAKVSVLNVADGKIFKEIKVQDEPEGVNLAPDGKHVYVTCETRGEVFVIDTETNEALTHFVVRGRPRTVAFLPDGSRAYVPAETLGTVSVVDTSTHKVIQTIELPKGARPMGTLVSSDGARLYVSGGRATYVYAIGTKMNQVVGSAKVGTRAWGMAFSPDEKFLFVANGPSNDVSVVDVATMKEVARVKCGESPWGVAVVKNPNDETRNPNQ